MQLAGPILPLIGRYGYLVIFFGVMAESAGIPLPGETILIAAGALVHHGTLNPGEVLLFGILGAIIGDQIGYWVGRKGGRSFVLRWGHYIFVTPERLEGAEGFFARHGGQAVFLARFVTGLRVSGALAAGTSERRRNVGDGGGVARLLPVGEHQRGRALAGPRLARPRLRGGPSARVEVGVPACDGLRRRIG